MGYVRLKMEIVGYPFIFQVSATEIPDLQKSPFRTFIYQTVLVPPFQCEVQHRVSRMIG